MADFTDSFYFTDEPDNSASKETAHFIQGTTVFAGYKTGKSAKELLKKHRKMQHAREAAKEVRRAEAVGKSVGNTMSEAGNLAERRQGIWQNVRQQHSAPSFRMPAMHSAH